MRKVKRGTLLYRIFSISCLFIASTLFILSVIVYVDNPANPTIAFISIPFTILFGLLPLLISYKPSENADSSVVQSAIVGQAELQDIRDRLEMVSRVEAMWIKGYLAGSLYNEIVIRLKMREKLDAVNRPGDLMIRKPPHPDRNLPMNTKMIQVFDSSGGQLLILGEPGHGKTTMLLDLASELLVRAKTETIQRIPVIFNLSLWARDHKPLDEWIVDELVARYRVSQRLARKWAGENKLTLLFDGLDELDQPYRGMCVEAINRFQEQIGLIQIVVCSRTQEYSELATKLSLQSAVLLQPLSDVQIANYFTYLGDQAKPIWQVLQSSNGLMELAQSPFMLNVIILTFLKPSDLSVAQEDLPKLVTNLSPKDQKSFLLNTYIKRVFEWQANRKLYSQHDTIASLTWLSKQMNQRNLAIFYVDAIDPDWLPTRFHRIVYAVLFRVIYLFISLGIALIMSLMLGGIKAGLVGGVVAALVATIVDLLWGAKIVTALEVHFVLTRQPIAALIGTMTGGILGGLLGLIWNSETSGTFFRAIGQSTNTLEILIIAFIRSALIATLVGGSLAGATAALASQEERVKPIEKLKWSRSAIQKHVKLIIVVSISLCILGLGIGIVVGFITRASVFSILIVGLVPGLGAATIFTTILGSTNTRLEDDEKIVPNQSLGQSIKNALYIGPRIGLTLGLILGLGVILIGVAENMPHLLRFGVVVGLFAFMISGLGAALTFGGFALTKHYSLRLIMLTSLQIPLRFVRFLNFATSLILLRRVGGGYTFLHRILLDHFAEGKVDYF